MTEEPTEQFPYPPPLPEPPFTQRHRAALLAGAVVVVAIVVGIVWAVLASSDSTAAPAPSTTAAPPPSSSAPTSGAQKAKHPMTRGTVTAESGTTWTVKTDSGDTVSVTVSDKTKFGTEKAPVDKSKIAVNSKVVITGENKDGKVEARRIRLAEKS